MLCNAIYREGRKILGMDKEKKHFFFKKCKLVAGENCIKCARYRIAYEWVPADGLSVFSTAIQRWKKQTVSTLFTFDLVSMQVARCGFVWSAWQLLQNTFSCFLYRTLVLSQAAFRCRVPSNENKSLTWNEWKTNEHVKNWFYLPRLSLCSFFLFFFCFTQVIY